MVFLMGRRPPRTALARASPASEVYRSPGWSVFAAPHAAAREAERAPLEISSNKGSYVRDDTVVVSVSVENRLADGSHVIIPVWAPGDKML